ncbi:MAG TPA: hypothetical protein VN881_14125 [Candidatus Acidoferrales bacterium]|nr:hypothetical protein [Candidatus Acidoferrales bacterium]
MHSGIATRSATGMLNAIAMHNGTETQSATGKPGPDRVQQESIKSQTTTEDRLAYETSDSPASRYLQAYEFRGFVLVAPASEAGR